MNTKGIVYRRCGCRDTTTGSQLSAACPRLEDPGHGTWYFAIDVPHRVGGLERRRVRRGGYPNQEAAEAALAQYRRPAPRRENTAEISTGEWLRTWIDARTTLAPISRDGYDIHIRLYLAPHLGEIPLTGLRRAHVQEMFDRIAERGAAGIPLCPNTQIRIRATLRAALNAAVREGLIETNPACGIKIDRYHRKHAVVWTEEEIARWKMTGQRPPIAVWTATQTAAFLTASHNHRLYAAFHLTALRGLRRAETAGLRWCDIDLDHGILLVNQTIQRVGGQLTLCPPKSEASRRTVVLDRNTVKELRRHRERQAAEARERGFETGGFVFTNRRGRPLNPDHLYREFIRASRDAGLPPIRLHDLRHGAGTLALEAGSEMKVIQDKLGHASIVLTADTYVSVTPTLDRREAESTARLVRDAARNGVGGTCRRRTGICSRAVHLRIPTAHIAGHRHRALSST
jgi:integrase